MRKELKLSEKGMVHVKGLFERENKKGLKIVNEIVTLPSVRSGSSGFKPIPPRSEINMFIKGELGNEACSTTHS